MATHYSFYGPENKPITPWNRQYDFPTQANKALKTQPRISPQSGTSFRPGENIRVVMPANGYMNPINSHAVMDITLTQWTNSSHAITRFQNNISSVFKRGRVFYGSNIWEDISEYGMVVRMMTELTGTNQIGTIDQMSIADGVGGVLYGPDNTQDNPENMENTKDFAAYGLLSVRQTYIQGLSTAVHTASGSANNSRGKAAGIVPNGTCTQRYMINLAFGIMLQAKLIPLKFMSSQFGFEFTVQNADECIFSLPGIARASAGTPPTFTITNFQFIPEIYEFDRSYDEGLYAGLKKHGIPIQFASWRVHTFATQGNTRLQLPIHEQSRSIKSIFFVQRRMPVDFSTDSHAFLLCSNSTDNNTNPNTLQSYQFLVGNHYYPGEPVQVSRTIGDDVPNSGCEAKIELEKALNQIGDYRLSTSNNRLRWAIAPSSVLVRPGDADATESPYSEFDYATAITRWNDKGQPLLTQVSVPSATTGNIFASNVGSACFVGAMDFETSNGLELAGLNAEEQNNIILILNYAKPQNPTFVIQVCVYYDALITIKEFNEVVLEG